MIVIFIRVIYTLLAAIALLFELVPWTREAFVKYGKTRNVPPGLVMGLTRPMAAWFAQITVPKNLFAHFYSIGVIVSGVLVADLVSWNRCRDNSDSDTDDHITCLSPLRFCLSLSFKRATGTEARTVFYPHSSAILAFCMYNLHIVLRLKESFYDQPTSTARIHIGQFGVGIIFYVITPFAVFVDSCYRDDWQNTPAWLMFSGFALYSYASVHQWRCHHILFGLRSRYLNSNHRDSIFQNKAPNIRKVNNCTQQPYSIPAGDLFDYVSNPHYLCEILIYASLCMLMAFQERTLLWTLAWTIINLGITSRESHLWYCKTFGSKYPRSRRALVPFIW